MKISDLVKRTQVSKQTIHYYVREGLVPRPPKFAKNLANYNESYVERIRLIKELQDHHFLPLSLIKRVLKYQKGTPERKPLLQVQTNYFRPVDQLLPADVIGEQDFRKNTGLSRKWLARLEEWGVITPETREDRKVYCQDDVILGRLVVDMGRIGLGPKDGFDAEALKYYGDAFQKVATKSHEVLHTGRVGQCQSSGIFPKKRTSYRNHERILLPSLSKVCPTRGQPHSGAHGIQVQRQRVVLDIRLLVERGDINGGVQIWNFKSEHYNVVEGRQTLSRDRGLSQQMFCTRVH